MKILRSINNIFFMLLFALCIIAAFFYGLNANIVNDGLWHIKVGEYIITHHQIPHKDIFSWYGISHNFNWISHEWLFGVIAYLIYSIDQFTSVYFFIIIINILNTLLLYSFSYMRSKNRWFSLIVSYCYVIYGSNFLDFRPQILSITLILIMLMFLEYKRYYCTLAVLVLAVNVHGGVYPIYLIIVGAYTLFKNYKYILMALLAILVNPYTYQLYLYTYKNIHENSILKGYITEWATTPLFDDKMALAVILVTVLIYMFSNISFRDFFLSGVMILLSLDSIRHKMFLYIILLPIISPYINESICGFVDRWIPDMGKFRIGKVRELLNVISLRVRKELEFNRYIVVSILLTVILQTGTVVIAFIEIENYMKNTRPLFTYDISNSPVKAVQYIKNHEPIANSHLFTEYNDSGYIIFSGLCSFVDSRQDLFTFSFNKTDMFNNYYLLNMRCLKPETYLKLYDIDYLLLNKSAPFYPIFKDEPMVSIEYEDNNYCLFKVIKEMQIK